MYFENSKKNNQIKQSFHSNYIIKVQPKRFKQIESLEKAPTDIIQMIELGFKIILEQDSRETVNKGLCEMFCFRVKMKKAKL